MGRLGDLMRPGGNQLRGQSAFAMLHPALGGRLDYPDVAGLAAPKPMLFLSGRHDRHFPAEIARAPIRCGSAWNVDPLSGGSGVQNWAIIYLLFARDACKTPNYGRTGGRGSFDELWS